MSLVTQAFIFERYGARLNTEQLAELLGDGTWHVPTYVDMGIRFADYRAVAAATEAAMAAGRTTKAAPPRAPADRPASRRSPVAWANVAAIDALYAEARRLTEATGVRHVVDHVIPVTGRLVTGLHVETNLQILTQAENGRKRNRYEIE